MRARSDMLLNGQNDVAPVNGQPSEFSEDIETVQDILRQYNKDNELQVTEIVCCPGSKAGDNYMSLIKRIVATIRTKSNAGECRIMRVACFLLFHVVDSCAQIADLPCTESSSNFREVVVELKVVGGVVSRSGGAVRRLDRLLIVRRIFFSSQ